MKKFIFSTVLATSLMIATAAFAMDLHEARDAGILGEKNDGYVAVLKKSAEAEALAAEVNSKRKQEYTRISKQNSQPVAVVGKLAAQQIIEGLNAGDRYQDASGAWQTR